MLHPLCQVRLAQYRGEKATNKQMNKGNKRADSFPCQAVTTHVEIQQSYWDTAAQRVIQQWCKVWACVKDTQQLMMLIHIIHIYHFLFLQHSTQIFDQEKSSQKNFLVIKLC